MIFWSAILVLCDLFSKLYNVTADNNVSYIYILVGMDKDVLRIPFFPKEDELIAKSVVCFGYYFFVKVNDHGVKFTIKLGAYQRLVKDPCMDDSPLYDVYFMVG